MHPLPPLALWSALILAASAAWVAVLLNVIPGLGAGYLYQRRWKAYWITVAVAVTLLTANAIASSSTKGAYRTPISRSRRSEPRPSSRGRAR